MTRFGLFGCCQIDYAVPLLQLCKVVHGKNGFLLPGIEKTVVEVLVDDGRLIPLLFLPGLSHGDSGVARTAEYKIIVESEAGLIAFSADRTFGVVAENKGEILDSGENGIVGVAGNFKYKGKVFSILDVDFLAIKLTRGG